MLRSRRLKTSQISVDDMVASPVVKVAGEQRGQDRPMTARPPDKVRIACRPQVRLHSWHVVMYR